MTSTWNPFLEEEFTSTMAKCNILSTLGPNKLVWRYLKHIIKNKLCLKNIINITNTCLEIGYWPSHFKISTTIVIPKPNKVLYNTPSCSDLLFCWTCWVNLLKKLLVIDFNFMQFLTTSSISANLVVSSSNPPLTLALCLYTSFVWSGSGIYQQVFLPLTSPNFSHYWIITY